MENLLPQNVGSIINYFHWNWNFVFSCIIVNFGTGKFIFQLHCFRALVDWSSLSACLWAWPACAGWLEQSQCLSMSVAGVRWLTGAVSVLVYDRGRCALVGWSSHSACLWAWPACAGWLEQSQCLSMSVAGVPVQKCLPLLHGCARPLWKWYVCWNSTSII